jgi:hypothetical protein
MKPGVSGFFISQMLISLVGQRFKLISILKSKQIYRKQRLIYLILIPRPKEQREERHDVCH